jgi:hypothetical protein
MRPWQVILMLLAIAATFDYVVNDADGIHEVVDWLVRTGRVIARAIESMVISLGQ